MQDLRALLEVLDDVIVAYKRRIAELEAIAAQQQKRIAELERPAEPEAPGE